MIIKLSCGKTAKTKFALYIYALKFVINLKITWHF